MSRLPSQIATTIAPAQQKPQEARLKLRLNSAPGAAGAAGSGSVEDASNRPGTSDDAVMQEADDIVAAADAEAAVQEGVGSPGSHKEGGRVASEFVLLHTASICVAHLVAVLIVFWRNSRISITKHVTAVMHVMAHDNNSASHQKYHGMF